MNVLGIIRIAGEEFGIDSDGHITTHHWLLPETSEIIWGGLASVIIFAALFKFAGPMIKKSFADRTARIQKDLDGAAEATTSAAAEAAGIRQAKGDIAGERARLLAEADAQAVAMLEDGRARIVTDMADLEAKAQSDIAVANSRVGDELRAEISRLSSAAVDHVVTGSLDEATHQELIESFIAKVGGQR